LTNTEAPKSTDLSGYHPDYLAYVAAELNDRPRKRLGVLPTEVDDGQRVEVR
jgi:IS30 family transposase